MDCRKQMMRDAYELLKNMQKTKVVFMQDQDGNYATKCENCNLFLDKAYSRCPRCQKELDWNINQN